MHAGSPAQHGTARHMVHPTQDADIRKGIWAEVTPASLLAAPHLAVPSSCRIRAYIMLAQGALSSRTSRRPYQSRPSYSPSPLMATAPCTCHFRSFSSDMPSASHTWAVSSACFCGTARLAKTRPDARAAGGCKHGLSLVMCMARRAKYGVLACHQYKARVQEGTCIDAKQSSEGLFAHDRSVAAWGHQHCAPCPACWQTQGWRCVA